MIRISAERVIRMEFVVAGRRALYNMMTRYARSYSLQKGPSLEDSVE